VSLETYGSYQLIKRLATGGMAQIYLARQTGLEGFEKLLVVKRILPHLGENEEFVRMFLDEARIAARLNHPNIVQIFNLGQQDNSFFIAMEYIHGEDVRRVWKRADAMQREFPIPLVCRVVMDACAGLDYAHKKADQNGKPLNIVHRDISPQNILVTFDGGVKVVDFGIAKAADQATVTRSGVLKGKYSYMSPEQASGQKLDCRSDIFALGVVLYELLTGTRLFKRTSDLQTLKAVTDCNVIPPSQVNPRVPADLDPVVMKALAKRVDDRYQESVQLQLALEDWLVKNQRPSSSAHLAAFMQEIYAERLDREAKEGRVVVEEVESLSPKSAEGSPNSPASSKESAGIRSKAPARSSGQHKVAEAQTESTTADRPPGRAIPSRSDGARTIETPRHPSGVRPTLAQTPRAMDSRRSFPMQTGELSMSMSVTETMHTRRGVPRWMWAVIAVLLIGGLGMFAAPYLRVASRTPPSPTLVSRPMPAEPPVAAKVQLFSEPSGAQVSLAGEAIDARTPCVLPSRPAGRYAIALRLEGFKAYQTQIDIPATGELRLPIVRLEREPAPVTPPAPEQTVSAPEHHASAPKKIAFTVKSEPPGATVFVDGQQIGTAPATVTLESRHTAAVRVELAGFRATERRVRVRQSDQEELIRLESASAPPSHATGTGNVTFVLPLGQWANVSCNNVDFGQTPFPPKDLSAGTYKCKFSNPDMGTKTRTVEVHPGDKQVVKVDFAPNPTP
jgi:serine/threonine protein kinase